MAYQIINGRLVARAATQPTARSYRSTAEQTEGDQSLLSSIGSASLSYLGATGNLLDIPGSMARDVLSGNNPFDQLLTPFSSDNRSYGRDILSNWGIMRPNKETGISGWLDDPMEGVRDITGFAFDMSTDPLLFINGPAAALSRGGQFAKSSGLMGRLGKVAGKGVGPRVGRIRHTLGDLLQTASPIEREAAENAAQKMGIKLSDIVNEPLGGVYGLGVPFKEPSVIFGKAGGIGEKFARGMDTIGHALRYGNIPGTNISPGNQAAALFTRNARGALTETGQGLGKTATDLERQAGVEARDAFAAPLRQYDEFKRTLAPGGDKTDKLRASIESDNSLMAALENQAPLPQNMAHLQPIVDEIRQMMPKQLSAEVAEGLKTSDLDDLFVEYSRRERFFFPGDKSKSEFPSRLLSGKHGSQINRKDFLRDIRGGTQLINHLSIDGALSGIAHKMAPGLKTKAFWDTQETAVRGAMRAFGAPNWMNENIRDMAKWLADLDPRHAEKAIPVFAGNPLEWSMKRIEIGKRAMGMSKAIRETLSEPGNTFAFHNAPPGSVPITEVFEKAGLNTERSAQMVAGQQAATKGSNLYVPRELADDIGRVVKTFQTPDEVTPILKAVDGLTRLFKAGVTSFPAFHVRNLMSGQIQNMIIGAWSWRSFNDTDKLLRGRGPIKGLQSLGKEFSGLSDEAATRKLADQVFADNVAPRGQGVELEDLVGTSLDTNLAHDIPGVAQQSFGDIASTSIPRNLEQANPLNVAGVRTQTDVFAPVAGSRKMGSYIEGMNRIAPYLELRRKGFSRAQAAKRVRAAQVDYNSLSSFERSTMRRVAPFYSFSRGMSEFVAKELLERPGGRLGQTIRAQNAGTDQNNPLPEHISQTTAIPLSTADDGTQKFITGLGLMHEDPMSFIGGGLTGTLTEMASRLNPLGKAPLELAAGESFFQRGPMGGRDLADMDPTLGRIATKLGFQDELPSGRAKPVGGRTFEHLFSNSPLSRAGTTLRTLLDDRKGMGGKLTNLLSGVRVSDLSVAGQEAVIRDQASALARDQGARVFETVYFSKDVIAKTAESDPEAAQKMLAFNRLRNLLAARSRKRKKSQARGSN